MYGAYASNWAHMPTEPRRTRKIIKYSAGRLSARAVRNCALLKSVAVPAAFCSHDRVK
ncbi:Uncharacterised protein [Mycobacteroides abscessus subsp. abscessus]|nr:Uncharacterised protein [Mycobacteroides abscessus subsp. abscessus]